MKLIYTAGPYTGDTDQNILDAELAMISLIKTGWAVICPHKNTAHCEKYEKDGNRLSYKTWLKMDIEILDRCDAIFMLEKWESSKGARKEYCFATLKPMPIYYQKDGYPVPPRDYQRI